MHTSVWSAQSVLCFIFLVTLHLSHARFGDDDYWRSRMKIDCKKICPRPDQLCDGKPNCEDESDERDCSTCSSANAFHCNNNICLPIQTRCNGIDECGDGSDERGCDQWISPWGTHTYAVPANIERYDMSDRKIRNFTAEVERLGANFTLNFYAYNLSDPNHRYDAYTLSYLSIRKIAFYTHGFITELLDDGENMKNAFAAGADDIDFFVEIDWRRGSFHYDILEELGGSLLKTINDAWKWDEQEDDSSGTNTTVRGWWWELAKEYRDVVNNNLPVVANELARFVSEYITPLKIEVYFIGFSLGGQISGMAARMLKNMGLRTVDRISALDPAGPIFEYSYYPFLPLDTTNTLRKTDAKFIDVVHACPYLGMVNDAGHLDIKIEDADCYFFNFICLHHKSVEVYIESINNCSQITCPAEKMPTPLDCKVDSPSELGSLGYLADLYHGRGRHIIYYYTEYKWFHNTSTGLCNTFKPLYLPAKNRICRRPPTITSDCRSKPYLTECNETCEGVTRKTVCTKDGVTLYSAGRQPAPSIRKLEKVYWIGKKCYLPMSCYDEWGNSVQYFIAYKKPNSYNYSYFSRKTDKSKVRVSTGKYLIYDPRSVLGRTLLPVYEQVKPISYLMWNDYAPHKYGLRGNSSLFGHSRGVLAHSSYGGLLLTHSVQNFPPDPRSSSYDFPATEFEFAEIAICVTSHSNNATNMKDLKSMLSMMVDFKPQVYAWKVQGLPQPLQIIIDKLINPKPTQLDYPKINIGTFGKSGASIHSFGQSLPDLYQDCFQRLAVFYRTPILAETWMDRQLPLPPNCEGNWTVENVKKIEMFNISWEQTVDRSNWIVPKTEDLSQGSHVLCIGDLYRAKSTIVRGGMFVCLEDEETLSMFLNYVKIRDFQHCPIKGENATYRISIPLTTNDICS